jgi:hypothetical protein
MIYCPELYTPKRKVCVKRHDAYLRNNPGICSAILADALDVTERFVISRQRKLRLRPFTGNHRKGARHATRAEATL